MKPASTLSTPDKPTRRPFLRGFKGKTHALPLSQCHSLPTWLSLILKGCLFRSLLSRRAEALNSNGLSADGDSPLAPSAQHRVCAKPVGVDKVQLSQKWCSAVTPSAMGCL